MTGSAKPIIEVADLACRLRDFADARDWHQFHTPKNLVMALTGEVGELVSELQWLSDSEVAARLVADEAFRELLGAEIADVVMYLVRLADVLQIDLAHSVEAKLASNESRYRADQVRGSHRKMPHL